MGQILFRKVTIVGVGLIGGSLGLAIKKNQIAREVVGLSQRHTTLATALKMGAIDQGYHDIKKSVTNADLVVMCTPVSIIIGMMSMIAPYLKRGCIITDVGSTKLPIVNAAQEHLPQPAFFLGSHPLAGSEKQGVQNAVAELFEKALCIITPVKTTNRTAYEMVKRFWTRVGANVKVMAPEQHDKALAYVSHLPHLVAYGLIKTVPDEFLELAAQGLKDSTRIAASSPQMWHDIAFANAKNIIPILDDMVRNLSVIRKSVVTNDSKTLLNLFKIAKTKRDTIL